MLSNKERIGNFTSSEIVALTTSGKKSGTYGAPFDTYVSEKNYERQLGECLGIETFARSMAWGNFLEQYLFAYVINDDMRYFDCHDKTIIHPTISYWSGSQDAIKNYENGTKAASELKCPFTKKSFCQLVQPIYDGLTGITAMNAIRNGYTLYDEAGKEIVKHKKHKDGEKYYWQIVSNAILNETNLGEFLVFMPYHDEIEVIQELLQTYDKPDMHNYFFIANALPGELPSLKRDGFYKNLNRIEFAIPQTDIDFLTERVEAAGKLLIDRKN